MKKFNWSGYEWISGERWGNIHPNKAFQWYDPDAIEIQYNTIKDCDQLILKTHLNPKYFNICSPSITTELPGYI